MLTAGLLYWQASRPQVYDNGGAEVLYTDQDGAYQVLVGWMSDRFTPDSYLWQPVDEGDRLYTFPQCLYINYPESGANAKDDFMAKVERVTAAFIDTADEDWPWTCDEPIPREDYIPEAARVSSIHFYAASGAGRLRWTIEMKNGDVIHLYQEAEADPQKVYQFTPEDTPLYTAEEVQALLVRLDDITIDYRYMENVFHRNGTAVLLERVGSEELLAFPGSIFSENEVDVDNRCGQALDIS